MVNVTTDLLHASKTYNVEPKQFAIETRLVADGAIGKVLSTCATPVVDLVEILHDELDVAGKIEVKVLYIDGEGARKVLKVESPFREKILASVIPNDYCNVLSSILEVSTLRAEMQTMTIKSVVELKCSVTHEEPIEIAANCGSDVYLKSKQASFLTPIAKIDNTFIVIADKEIDDIENDIMDLDCDVCLTNITARDNALLLDGETVTNALYKATDGRLKNNCYHISFSQEIAFSGIEPNATADLTAQIVSHEHAVANIDGQATVLKSMYTVRVSGTVFAPKTCSCITDAFSVTRGIKIRTQDIKFGSVSLTHIGHPIEGSCMLEDSMPACDTVLGVTAARVVVANCFPKDGRTTVDGLLNASVLYYNKATGSTNAVAVDLPFSVSLNLVSSGDLTAKAVVLGVGAKSIRPSKIDVQAEVFFCVKQMNTQELTVVKDVEDKGDIQLDSAAISVRIAGANQELWDLAKACELTPECVIAQNPDLTFPTKGGEKVVIYRKLCV